MIKFKKYLEKSNNGHLNYNFKTKILKDRVQKICKNIIEEHCASSKYITKIYFQENNKSVSFDIQINDLYVCPFGDEKKETYQRIQNVKIDLKSILDRYLFTPNKLFKQYNFSTKNIIVKFEDKYFQYNEKLFANIFISDRDKLNIDKFKNIVFLFEHKNNCYMAKILKEEFNTISLTKKFMPKELISFNNFKIEKNFKILNNYFNEWKKV